jgi:hypothetical protein
MGLVQLERLSVFVSYGYPSASFSLKDRNRNADSPPKRQNGCCLAS